MQDIAHPSITTLIAPTVNVLILVTVLAAYLRKPLTDFVQGRHVRIREDLHGAGKDLKTAQAKFEEFSAKLKAIDSEITSLRDQARRDAASARLRIVTEAKRLSEVIVSDARSSAQSVFQDLRMSLLSDFSKRVLDRAEADLRARLTGDDRARIRREFSNKVETLQ